MPACNSPAVTIRAASRPAIAKEGVKPQPSGRGGFHGLTLPYPNQPLQDTPTTQRIMELLRSVTIIRYWSENVVNRSMAELT